MADDVWADVPWLAGRRVAAGNQAAVEVLRESLDSAGYSRRELEGERIVSDESFFDAVTRAFDLDEAPSEWDGVVEAIAGMANRLGPREAVVWHRADASGFFSLRTVVEAVSALLEAGTRLGPDVRLDVVLLGQTRDFPHPEGP